MSWIVVLASLLGVFTAQTSLPSVYGLGIASIAFQHGILLTGGSSSQVDITTLQQIIIECLPNI
jgi:hypothetical protein